MLMPMTLACSGTLSFNSKSVLSHAFRSDFLINVQFVERSKDTAVVVSMGSPLDALGCVLLIRPYGSKCR